MKNKLFLSFSISEERTGKNRYFFLVPYGVVCVRYSYDAGESTACIFK